jgi:hypothetical protein
MFTTDICPLYAFAQLPTWQYVELCIRPEVVTLKCGIFTYPLPRPGKSQKDTSSDKYAGQKRQPFTKRKFTAHLFSGLWPDLAVYLTLISNFYCDRRKFG